MKGVDVILKEVKEVLGDYTQTPLPPTKCPASGKIWDQTELINAISAVLEGWWTEGKWCVEFSKLFSLYTGIKYCLPVNSGSSACLLAVAAVKELDRSNLSEIMTPALNFPTTVNSIWQNGLTPHFVDCDSYRGNHQLSRGLDEKAKGYLFPHMLGFPTHVYSMKWIIEDCCDALGSYYDYRIDKCHVGSKASIACFSFYPAHQICTGEGGMVCTQEEEIADTLRSLRDWGRDCKCKTGQDNVCGARFDQQHGQLPQGYDHKFTYRTMGYNCKMTDLQAALGVAQMAKLPEFTKKRQANYHLLCKLLDEANLGDKIEFRDFEGDISPFGFPLQIINKKYSLSNICHQLEVKGVGTRPYFAGNILKQPYLCKGQYLTESLENTERFMRTGFWIGCWPGLTDHHLEYMVKSLKEVFA